MGNNNNTVFEEKDYENLPLDWSVKALTTAGLQRDITLKETFRFRHFMKDGTWAFQILGGERSGVANINKFKQFQQFLSKNQEISDMMQVDLRLTMGDRFPILDQLRNIECDNQEIQHKQGEILLVITWLFWRPYEEALLELAKSWKGNVRVVCVRLPKEDDDEFKEIQAKYSMHQHIGLRNCNQNYRFSHLLQIESLPTVCLVNQAGIIDYLGHASGIDLERRIPELLSQKPEEAPKTSIEAEEPRDLAGQQLWAKFRTVIKHLPKPPKKTYHVKLQHVRTRTFKDGKTTVAIQDIRLFSQQPETEEQVALYKKLLKKIVKDLDPSEYLVDVNISHTVKDPEIFFNYEYDLIQDILTRNGVKDKPIGKVVKSIDLKTDTRWKQSNHQLRYPNIAYQGKTNISLGKKIKEDYQNRRMQNEGQSGKYLIGIYPFTLEGNKFAGIHGVLDFTTGAKKDIVHQEGITQIICFCPKNQNNMSSISQEFTRQINPLLGKYNAVLHLIDYYMDSEKFISTSQMIKEVANHERVKVYSMTCFSHRKTNEDLNVFERSVSRHKFVNSDGVGLIIVDRFGTVVDSSSCKGIESFESVLKSCQNPYSPPVKAISEGFLKFLQNLSNEEIYKSTQTQIQGLKYGIVVQASFVEEYSKEMSVGHSVKLVVKIKQDDKHIVQPLLKIFEEESEILIQYIAPITESTQSSVPKTMKKRKVIAKHTEFIEIPQGTSCSECEAELRLPYYYFPTSNVHKCVDCIQKQDQAAAETLEPPAHERSILVFSDRRVPDTLLGKDLKPQTKDGHIQDRFRCKGCQFMRIKEVRFICLECRQGEEAEQGYVEFCDRCIAKLRGTNQASKQVIYERTEPDGHTKGHALLRVEYAPDVGYLIQ